MEPRYDHLKVEGRIYEGWERSGFFDPDKLPGGPKGKRKDPFTIIMPPPNANGDLHIGHAVFVTLQDIMIRFARMRGKRALWVPGADHAGFETQVVFDKKLEKEKRDRAHMTREEVWQGIWDFTQKNKATMESQLRKLGASCDWSREKFTLDPDIVRGTQETFIAMYRDGLIYRGYKVVNWCPKHRTALSDLEVKYVERKDPLYYIKYGPLTLATVRPETKFGDTGIAVNPKDDRYKQYIGKEIEGMGILGPMKFKVIGDDSVDPAFGTGVVKVTPAHDAVDFDIWTRHKNEIPGPKIVIDESGRLTGETGPFKGLKVAEAREKVAEAMREKGILEKIDPEYVHQVATCYKCGSTLEPLPKPQWFVKTEPLAKKAVEAVHKKKLTILPDHSAKVYLHWLENIRDWNISRQIVWGIRIPAWFHEPKCVPRVGHEGDVVKCKEFEVSIEKPKCEFCDAEFVQDPDVFDTWFSSGQWPYLVLGYPKGSDYKNFYPTDVLETAYDILFFWVTRMVMLGIYRTGKVPFHTVYLHGLVRDKDRQKMSKSKGNVVNPLGVAETYGTDALRMALVVGNTPGSDIIISEDKVRGYRNFATKIWNIARFIDMNRPAGMAAPDPKRSADAASGTPSIIAKRAEAKEFEKLRDEVAKHLDDFEFHLAAEKVYHYVWHTLADKLVEAEKKNLREGTDEQKKESYALLEYLLLGSLKMLHPFMPFVTEEVFDIFRPGKMLMVENW